MRRAKRIYRPTFQLSGERPRSLWRRITPVSWLIVGLLVLFAALGAATAARLDARVRADVLNQAR